MKRKSEPKEFRYREVEEKPVQVYQWPKNCMCDCHVVVVVVPVPECCFVPSCGVIIARKLLHLYFTCYSKYFENNARFDSNDFNY